MRGLLTASLAALAAAAAFTPAAAAGTAEMPEVTDPSGDTAAFGAPAPAGLGWADVQAAWFERDGDRLRLTIRVGDGAEAPPMGEVGVTFRVGDRHFIAGYTVVPGLYSGGFLSESDANGDVPANVSPASADGTFSAGTVVATFAIADVAGNGNATGLAQPWGWSESRATNGEDWRLDRTAVGSNFTWVPPPEGPGGGEGPAGPVDGRESPAPGMGATLTLLAVAALAAARRR